ncbi:catabolic L-serine/threonine dehydratase [Lambiella insularis]|nr:catabolic L-serine/threonine dehydratase [Lambiella insularis]
MGSMPERELPKPWIETPLVESAALSKAAGCRIFLKLENLQPSGSFKSRGIGNFVRQSLLRAPSAPLHFYISSGGNAGLACVAAARLYAHPASVVVPLSTSPFMVAKIRAAGATAVIQTGATWAEADRHLREVVLAADPHGVYVPPFDHADVWAGASTMVEEMAAQMGGPAPDAVVCSVGGGGLFAGVMEGMARVGWGGRRVLAVETEGAASLARSVERGELVTLPEIRTIATSLGAKRVAGKALEWALKEGTDVRCVVLRDEEAAMGCWRLADDERVLVEAGCGVSVALCYDGRLGGLVEGLNRESRVVVVLCGGSNVSLEMLMGYREKYGGVEGKGLVKGLEEVPSTVTAPR